MVLTNFLMMNRPNSKIFLVRLAFLSLPIIIAAVYNMLVSSNNSCKKIRNDAVLVFEELDRANIIAKLDSIKFRLGVDSFALVRTKTGVYISGVQKVPDEFKDEVCKLPQN